ncbi:GNAT family N-acetyltransferase [Alteribacter lacisalsi]|uniref:GNAT family N-acetyltransferase n=1 Tax=Alteribacter lacisalsi TaxID=2045244 RepID=A0A2W0HAF2_9BACI|nr:GNAT family N-acetyltransferase [Alteribacter lacisalsi]
MNTRKAEKRDSRFLSSLAYKSKAYWGYSEEFLDKCKEDPTVTEEDIEENPVFVVESDGSIVAFYSFTLNEASKLESLFIDPDYIGKGVGRVIWRDVLTNAKDIGLSEFYLDSEPYAEGFYSKMGADKVGTIQSTVFPGRSLPLMKVTVE